ncbi:MAG: Cu(I)-responsive transcriptional regulator [Methylotenera sp.]|jgi:MerR family copper efflux transcriptional regulator|uniref:Cu(I)-responsive transcriptional regulator n=1 Tax=Methylotenera sp. TaxID=2051956 RepID=UPI000D424DE5|nr:Cu(I)-responsive transcriptional regulator [Methylotenera sp.]PPC80883.1 MAG: Cu(I)-responsive transcriptional regulator [Methylotenera sp.]PPC96294.1 MAG: Cu(I)-responsive transcriptional regulator [Methylotenera sp.]
MDNDFYNIGEAASASGISAKMIRHYEKVELLPAASRTISGYRTYNPRDVHMLRFIKHSRDLGFSIKQIAALLSLWRDKNRSSREVKSLAIKHIEVLDQKIKELNAMKSELSHLVKCCHGDERPDCPILDELAIDEI